MPRAVPEVEDFTELLFKERARREREQARRSMTNQVQESFR